MSRDAADTSAIASRSAPSGNSATSGNPGTSGTSFKTGTSATSGIPAMSGTSATRGTSVPPIAPAVSVVLHDVTPASWERYDAFVRAVDALGDVPLTLLVVPDFHGHLRLESFPAFCAAIDGRLARGDEVALHGYFHHDDSPFGPLHLLDPREVFMRRIYTHEGEFYRLDDAVAAGRIEHGLELFRRLHWPVAGFVAPGWLLGTGARSALAQFPFVYTSDMNGLWRLPGWTRVEAPSLVWSAGNALGRRASGMWNRRRLRRAAARPLIRLGLHPADMAHPDAVAFWLDTLESLLATRKAVTKRQWVASQAGRPAEQPVRGG